MSLTKLRPCERVTGARTGWISFSLWFPRGGVDSLYEYVLKIIMEMGLPGLMYPLMGGGRRTVSETAEARTREEADGHDELRDDVERALLIRHGLDDADRKSEEEGDEE